MKTFPPGPITPHGARRLMEGKEPHIAYIAHDGSTCFHLMGPFAPVPGVQPGVTISRESIKGLMGSWQTLDQAGANQDGVTFNDAVYQPTEIDMVVEASGRTPQETRQVIRSWIDSWDAHKQGELVLYTDETGEWWAPVRWIKTPTDALMRSQSLRQRFVWTCRIDDVFWRSHDSVGTFEFGSEQMNDSFTELTSPGLGENWPLYYTGSGGGYVYSNGSQAIWLDEDGFNTETRQVVCGPYKDFHTDTDNQIVSLVIGGLGEISLPETSYNDLWARMGRNPDGSWNGYGVRLRFGWGKLELARFNNFVKTVMFSRILWISPIPGDKFTLVAGYEGNSRLFKAVRNGAEIMAHKESGTGSPLGASYRGIGFGQQAGGALISQATPCSVRKVSAGDNTTVTQSGYVSVTNRSEIDSWTRFLLTGPGYFSLGNGPDTTDFVEFGPLLDGQVVLIETEPRRRAVVDLTPATVSTSQALNPFQQLIKNLVTFATNNNVPPLLQEFESLFGILPPQGNLYSYLTGRFTRPVPGKLPGEQPKTSNIFVKIDNGNASSKVVAAVTPRRRWPL